MLPKIRTITGFISTHDFDKYKVLKDHILSLKSKVENNGYEVQTTRITTDLFESIRNLDELSNYEDFLRNLDKDESISLYHGGPLSTSKIASDEDITKLVDFFLSHEKLFLTFNAGTTELSRETCLSAAKVCKAIAAQDPFECRRLAMYAGVTESTPFYPASAVFGNSMKLSIGLQCANLAVEEADNIDGNISLFESKLKNRMEKEFATLHELIDTEEDFIGFDTSLAPFPATNESIAYAIEKVLGKPFGSSGTLSICRLLTRIMQENSIKKTGLCGLMLAVVEDSVLAQRGIEGRYTLRELLSYSAVCATGLDTVPISGKTSEQDLANCYMDLATLAIKLQKPLSARFFIEPDKNPGDTIKYDWEFAAESPIFEV